MENYEFEMLSIGNADCTILRYLPADGREYVVLIDAGNKGDGEKIVDQIKKHTRQGYIDLAICTHPDSDHIGGFFHVVENLTILKFWIHDPSKHVDLASVKKNISEAKLRKSLRYVTESIDSSTNLLTLLDRLGVKREEPFTGTYHPLIPITVMGPTVSYYEQLLQGFRDIENLIKEEEYFEKAMTDISEEESLSEVLDKQDDLSCENNSSAILLFEPKGGKKFLFTADAGPRAFEQLQDPERLKSIFFLDIPHHGSKYNLNTKWINHFSPKIAVASSDGSRRYPSRAVVNALKAVNCKVYSTKGENKLYQNGIPNRDGYVTATPL